MSVEENIRKYRKENKLTQQQLADKVGVSKNSMQRYETGVRKPSFDVVKKIASVLKVSVDDLVSEVNELDKNKEIVPEVKEINEVHNLTLIIKSEEDKINFENLIKIAKALNLEITELKN